MIIKNGEAILGECLEAMKKLPDNSVDAIVTDPPYGLSFMGKKWDYDVPSVEIWQEALRVLKPGGYLLSFAGTRTQHRMAVRIEDAGFEIRDMIAWVYGSGFPKSLNIGKAVDKLQGNERFAVLSTRHSGTTENSPFHSKGITEEVPTNTKGTSEWEGWGTALKPALEPITVARKPLSEKTVADNCLKWGVGGIDIDGSRVETGTTEQNTLGRFPANLIHDGSDEVLECFPYTKSGNLNSLHKRGDGTGNSFMGGGGKVIKNYGGDSGSAARFFYCSKTSKSERNAGCEEMEGKVTKVTNMYEMERDNGIMRELASKQNFHPTVKPTALMEYLIKMVTKEQYTVLDPFMGSGSTILACENTNRKWIGIEMNEEYFEIAKNRISNNSLTLPIKK